MMRFTKLSHHGKLRLFQRTRVDKAALGSILDSGLFVNLGCTPGLNKEHLLFYSLKDDHCFVAIRDRYNGAVVTVLRIHYYKNPTWRITEKQKEKAKTLVLDSERSQEAMKVSVTPLLRYEESQNSPKTHISESESDSELSQCKVIAISCGYLSENGTQVVKPLAKLSVSQYPDADSFLQSPMAPTLLDEFAKRKSLDMDRVYALIIRSGKKLQPKIVELRDPNWIL